MGVVSKASIKNKLRQSQARYFDDLADSIATVEANTFTGIQTLSANLVANAGFVLGLQTVVAAGSDQAGAGAITAQGGAIVLCSTADNTKGIRLPLLSAVTWVRCI